MNNQILVDYNPINFNLFIFKRLLFSALFVFLCSLFTYYTMSSEKGLENYPFIITIALIVFFLLMIIIRLIISPFTFIYHLRVFEDKVFVKWQKNNKLNEEKFTFTEVTSKIVPSGRNNPYLKISFKKTNSDEFILKQYYHPKWTITIMNEINDKINDIF